MKIPSPAEPRTLWSPQPEDPSYLADWSPAEPIEGQPLTVEQALWRQLERALAADLVRPVRRDLVIDVAKYVRGCGHAVTVLSPGGIAVLCRETLSFRDYDLRSLPDTIEDGLFYARRHRGEDVHPPGPADRTPRSTQVSAGRERSAFGAPA